MDLPPNRIVPDEDLGWTPDTPCILWTGAVHATGYGTFGKSGRAHRKAWEDTNGPIPVGLLVLHRCDVPLCVRADHLFVGTVADNNRDRSLKGRSRATFEAANKAQRERTHCKSGHEFTEENTYIRKDGARTCRECQRRWVRNYKQDQKVSHPPKACALDGCEQLFVPQSAKRLYCSPTCKAVSQRRRREAQGCGCKYWLPHQEDCGLAA